VGIVSQGVKEGLHSFLVASVNCLPVNSFVPFVYLEAVLHDTEADALCEVGLVNTGKSVFDSVLDRLKTVQVLNVVHLRCDSRVHF